MPRPERVASPQDLAELCKAMNRRNKYTLADVPKAEVKDLCPPKPKRHKHKQ